MPRLQTPLQLSRVTQPDQVTSAWTAITQWFPNPESDIAARRAWFCNKLLDFLKSVLGGVCLLSPVMPLKR